VNAAREPGPVIILARHGDATWTGRRFAGSTDIPLVESGRAAAARLAASVAASGLLADPRSVVISSPLVRAHDTARAIAAAVDRPLRIDARWIEVGFGELEGRTYEEVHARWPTLGDRLLAADVAVDWPGGESWQALRERVEAAWAEVAGLGVPVAVVSHGIAIRVALAAAGVVRPGATAGELAPLPPAGALVLRRAGAIWTAERLPPADA
jgi:ribonuclease H / adenosylcobalamin/alpha-ribazole phosphatase